MDTEVFFFFFVFFLQIHLQDYLELDIPVFLTANKDLGQTKSSGNQCLLPLHNSINIRSQIKLITIVIIKKRHFN